MTPARLEQMIPVLVDWGQRCSDVLGMAITGSWARGEAKLTSDIDVSVLVRNGDCLRNSKWLGDIAWSSIDMSVREWRDRFEPGIWSRYVTLESGDLIDICVENMLCLHPHRIETLGAFCRGLRVLLDKNGFLRMIAETVESGPGRTPFGRCE